MWTGAARGSRILLFALLLGACGAQLAPMRKVAAPGRSLAGPPPEGRARVVFFVVDERSFDFGSPSDAFYVIDEKGGVLGALEWGSWFAIDLPAGEHAFFEWSPWTPNLLGPQVNAAMKASLAAGRTYEVQLTTGPRPFYRSAVLPHFAAVAPDEARLATLIPLEIDPASASRWAESHADSLRARVAEGQARLARGDYARLGEPPAGASTAQ